MATNYTKTPPAIVHDDDDLQISFRRGTDADGNPQAQAYLALEDGNWFPLTDVAGLNGAALRTELRKVVKHALELLGYAAQV